MFTINLSIAALAAAGAGCLLVQHQPALAVAYAGFAIGYLGLALV